MALCALCGESFYLEKAIEMILFDKGFQLNPARLKTCGDHYSTRTTRRNFLKGLAATLPLTTMEAGAVARGVDTTASHQPIQPWFHQAGLGLFLHWGIASVPGIELSWDIYQDAGKPNPYWPPEKYDALADQFNPQKYEPDVWLDAAVRAGFKYAIITTRHHDGYALWPSEYGNFSTRQHLQGRDLVQPFVESCRKHGLKVGLYYSPTDWHYNPPGWPHRAFPRRDPQMQHSHPQKLGIPKFVDMPLPEIQKYFDQFYLYVKNQVGELLTRYGKVDLLWWDGYEWPEGIDIHGEEMERYVRRLQPDIVENDRDFIWGPHKPFGDYNTDYENKDPAKPPADPWEQCEMMCGGWSYRGEVPCKSLSHVIERLVKNRAWGGNYLPDFGPRPDGTLSPSYYAICDGMAEWMRYGGASVFGVEPGPYPERCDVPVTRKGNVWYLHFVSPNQRSATLTGVGEPASARVLRTGEAATWKAASRQVVLTLPQGIPNELDEIVEVVW